MPPRTARCAVSVSVCAGPAVPAGGDLGRARARTSRCSPRTPSGSSCACSTTTARETADRGRDRTAFQWHCYLPGVGPGPALRLPRARAVRARRRGCASTRQAADRPLREGDRRRPSTGDAASTLPYVPTGDEDADLEPDDERRRRGDPEERRRRPALRLGGRPAPRPPLEQHGHLRDARQGLHDAASRTSRGAARHLRRPGLATPAIAYLQSLGVTAVELLPVHHIADESFLVDRGLSNYWGYSSIGYFAPHAALHRLRHARRAGARVQGDGQGAARAGHRGDPRRRLQPHRRGQPPRPDAVVQGHRQPRATTA